MTEQQLDLIVRLIKHMVNARIAGNDGRYSSSETHAEIAEEIIKELKELCHEEVNGAETN